MENYEISQKGIDAYKDELDKAEAEVEPEDIDYDDVDFSEPEDEETFRRQNKIMGKQMEQEERPFTSWMISESCQKIAESIDVLEQSIMKKPYYGMMIKYFSNWKTHLHLCRWFKPYLEVIKARVKNRASNSETVFAKENLSSMERILSESPV